MDTAVGIVRSYLELCGYFVLSELPVRERVGRDYRDVTDIDIVAVRFPHPPSAAGVVSENPLDLLLGSDPQLQTFAEGVDVIIGEVKEGRAEINPALRHQETIAFALRRLGCCPAAQVAQQAIAIAHRGAQGMRMDGMRCRIRLVLFAGYGLAEASHPLVVPLRRCIAFIQERMRVAPRVMAGTQWKDPTLAMFALLTKLDADRPVKREPSGRLGRGQLASNLGSMSKETLR